MQQDFVRKKYISSHYTIKQDGNVIVYEVPTSEIVKVCKQLYCEHKLQLKTITATDERKEGAGFRVLYVFGLPKENIFLVPYILVNHSEDFPSITKDILKP